MQFWRKKDFDLNYILTALNGFLAAASVFCFFVLGGGKYIDGASLALGLVLFLENHLILSYEAKKRNPLVLMFAFASVLFYAGRIPTLMIFSYSIPSEFNIFSHGGMHSTILFMIFANAAIFLGLYFKQKQRPVAAVESIHPSYPETALLCISAGIIYGLSKMVLLGKEYSFFNMASGYLGIVLNPDILVSFTAIITIIGWKQFSKAQIYAVFFLGFIFVCMQTLSGSRAGILTVALSVLYALLAVRGTIELSRKVILAAVVIAPISFILFFAGTYVRYVYKYYGHFEVAWNANWFNKSTKLEDIFNRLGYLDSTADIISNKKLYSCVINPSYYAKSVVDNVLTPGGMVFNAPRVSHALQYLYYGKPIPGIMGVNKDYRSDVLTIYGEYYVLMGPVLAVFFIFAVSWVLCRLYFAASFSEPAVEALYRVIVLMLFYSWINSFGSDWVLLDFISQFIFLAVFMAVIKLGIFSGLRLQWKK
ncbi:MAG: hypothetical protein NTW04_03365 [Elusimicrobia bacterium]|nr:hypothetical protein [Elusimicrobiota bacterium]